MDDLREIIVLDTPLKAVRHTGKNKETQETGYLGVRPVDIGKQGRAKTFQLVQELFGIIRMWSRHIGDSMSYLSILA